MLKKTENYNSISMLKATLEDVEEVAGLQANCKTSLHVSHTHTHTHLHPHRLHTDITQVMDKLGLGDSLLRTQLETQLRKEEEKRAKKQKELAEKQRQLAELELKAAEADKLLAALAAEGVEKVEGAEGEVAAAAPAPEQA